MEKVVDFYKICEHITWNLREMFAAEYQSGEQHKELKRKNVCTETAFRKLQEDLSREYADMISSIDLPCKNEAKSDEELFSEVEQVIKKFGL